MSYPMDDDYFESDYDDDCDTDCSDTDCGDTDQYSDDSSETLPCPNCGKEIYEDAERCPYCGEYVVFGGSPWAGRPAWWIVLGILGILATVLVLGVLY